MIPRPEAGNALGFLVCLAGLSACGDPPQGYVAAADLTRQGFVRDEAGHSFAVYVRNDQDRHSLLTAIVADARAGRATRVHVTGTLRTFDAPTNASRQTGIHLEVDTSSGVVLGHRPVP